MQVAPLSVVKADSLRAVLTLLVPGGIAILSWLCALVHSRPGLMEYAESHQVFSTATLSLVSLAVGYAINSLGSWWETWVNDRILSSKNKTLEEDWYVYLRTHFPEQPVGLRYMRNLVTTLKFELNTAVALLVLQLGLIVVTLQQDAFTRGHWFISLGVVLLLAAVLLWNSYFSSRALARLRTELRKGVVTAGDASVDKAGP